MKFYFSRRCAGKKEEIAERLFEIIPAAVSWSIITGTLVISFVRPVIAAAIIIAFNLYWLLRMFYMLIFLAFSYLKLSIDKQTDWNERIRNVDYADEYLTNYRSGSLRLGFQERVSFWTHIYQLKSLKRSKSLPARSQDIFHLVLIPVVKETEEIIESTIESISQSSFPPDKILVILALEERAGQDVKEGVRQVESRFKRRFLDLLVVEHPDGLTNEARVKGANISYAARQSARYFAQKQIPFENIIVSCFDADTVVSRSYFSCLTYNFMVCPQRERASFQPIPVYYNNIWEVPAFARIIDVGSSFFQLIEATNPQKLVTFSSHSMSFKALVDIGYWPVDMISDDSAIFWKAFLYYDGDYRVVPLYSTVSMDIPNAGSWRNTFVNVYRQKRRWAWGIENFPIVMRGFLRSRAIPFSKKFKHSFKLFEGHISWATWPFLLGVIGWFPAFFAGREFSSSVLYYSAPRIKAIIFNLASLGLLATSILSICLLPKPKTRYPFLKIIGHLFEWILVPLISIFLSAVPALDAQTRLARGKYMEFWVTEKKRIKKSAEAGS